MPYLKVGKENSSDIKIHYQDHGEGEALILIHGYPFSGVAWEKIEAKLLDQGYRVITYDRRGFGLSSSPSTGYDWDTFAQDLDCLLTELNLSDVTLVGHSMGTGEVTRYLSMYGSGRVSRAVFVAPIPPFILKSKENPAGVDKSILEGFKEAIKEDRYAFIAEFLKNFYNLEKLTGNKDLSDEKLKADFNLAAVSSPIAFLKCVDTWMSDFREDLPKIDIPSLIIQGDADKILPFKVTGEILAQKIAGELRVIEGGSHGIPWTHADEIAEEILSFMHRSHERIPAVNLSQEKEANQLQ